MPTNSSSSFGLQLMQLESESKFIHKIIHKSNCDAHMLMRKVNELLEGVKRLARIGDQLGIDFEGYRSKLCEIYDRVYEVKDAAQSRLQEERPLWRRIIDFLLNAIGLIADLVTLWSSARLVGVSIPYHPL